MTRGVPWLGGLLLVEFRIPLPANTYLWDVALWDHLVWQGESSWVDVTCWVRSIAVDRGRTPLADAFEAGVAEVVLANLDGRFSPWRRQSPYSVGGRSGVRPGMQVRISWGLPAGYWDEEQAWDQAETWDAGLGAEMLFWGVCESVVEQWPETVDAEVTVTASDAFRDLSAIEFVELETPDGAGETTDERINRILDTADTGWPRRVDAGLTTLLATEWGSNATQLVHLSAQSDGGEFYVSKDGVLRFDNGNRILTDPRMTTVQATFMDCPVNGELPYFDPAVVSNDEVLANMALISNGATTSRAQDNESIALYGQRMITRDSLVYEPEEQGDHLAHRLVSQRAQAVLRVESFTVSSLHRPQMPAVVARLELRDRVRFVREFATETLDAQLWVERIAHEITPTEWRCAISTAPAATVSVIPPDTGGVGWDTGRWNTTAHWEVLT